MEYEIGDIVVCQFGHDKKDIMNIFVVADKAMRTSEREHDKVTMHYRERFFYLSHPEIYSDYEDEWSELRQDAKYLATRTKI